MYTQIKISVKELYIALILTLVLAFNFHVTFDPVTTSNGCLSSDEFLLTDTISLQAMVLTGTVDYKETIILLLSLQDLNSPLLFQNTENLSLLV